MYKSQNTLSKTIDFTGIGLHSGEKVKISLIPTSTDKGINFKINNTLILASWKNAIVSQLCTRLKLSSPGQRSVPAPVSDSPKTMTAP